MGPSPHMYCVMWWDVGEQFHGHYTGFFTELDFDTYGLSFGGTNNKIIATQMWVVETSLGFVWQHILN